MKAKKIRAQHAFKIGADGQPLTKVFSPKQWEAIQNQTASEYNGATVKRHPAMGWVELAPEVGAKPPAPLKKAAPKKKPAAAKKAAPDPAND